MKKVFSLIGLLMMATLLLSSCLNADDSTTYYSDTAISSFSLGTLNRYIHTKTTAGKDSIYKSTFTGSSYSFYIDQNNKTIYNADSLPIWTDNSKAICTVGTKNGGVVYYKSLKSDSLFYYSSTDSIDFSVPRTLYVYSTDGTSYRKYTVNVNVHQEIADTFVWNKKTTNASVASFKGMKAFEMGDNILLFGSDGLATFVYSSSEKDGSTWTKGAMNVKLDGEAYQNMVKQAGVIYAKNNGGLVKSTDGTSWTVVTSSTPVTKLLGASTTELYALAGKSLVVSRDGGFNWSKDLLDADSTKLPASDFACYSMPLASNDSTDRVILVGSRSLSDYPTDVESVVWNKIVEYSKGSDAATWAYYNRAADNYYGYAPRLTNLTMVPYDDGVLAFGGSGIGSSTSTAFDRFYQSRDNGITWKNNSLYYFPDGFSCSKTSFTALKDASNYLWIFCGESGQVWKGRLNRLGWAVNQKSFTE